MMMPTIGDFFIIVLWCSDAAGRSGDVFQKRGGRAYQHAGSIGCKNTNSGEMAKRKAGSTMGDKIVGRKAG